MKILYLCALMLTVGQATAQKGKSRSSIEIDYSIDATHICEIGKDTIVVVAGATRSYTVDSPENQGPVSTGITASQLPSQLRSRDGSLVDFKIFGVDGSLKSMEPLETGDRLEVSGKDRTLSKTYRIVVKPMAVSGKLQLLNAHISINTFREITLLFTAGQRTPDATVEITLPAGINPTPDNLTLNIIGRGDVKLKDLPAQSMGRTGSNYSYSKVGKAEIRENSNGSHTVVLTHLDLRPANGPDVQLTISGVSFRKTGDYIFKAKYTTSEPEILSSAGVGPETAVLTAVKKVSDFERIPENSMPCRQSDSTSATASFRWSMSDLSSDVELMYSVDHGQNWAIAHAQIDHKTCNAVVNGLELHQLYAFRLQVKNGLHKGASNVAWFWPGKVDVKLFGVKGAGNEDDTDKINQAIDSLHRLGGGTLLFSRGIYNVRTVHLKSNVHLYVDKEAVIKAIKGADAPESTWFSDKQYRSGLSPTDTGPYEDPENYLTKQDVGHTFFRNTMFFGERIDNVKIIGNGRITGNGNLATSDKVMNNSPDSRADKMFTFKLCTNIEIGGIYREEDLWYDPEKDEPYYIDSLGLKDFGVDNMLHIDQGGHFVLLATGTDGIHVHDTYFARYSSSNARDIYDFMGCNDVTVTNIYSKVSSDDIVKLGSDCSLGFTRPATAYKVRNVIGDTNCNLFQIGSETADDITNVCVDNIYVLGSNKAGFSISTNDGAHVKDIHLNCGHTGPLHSRSKMFRTTTPFFISISNRGRVIGANVQKYSFREGDHVRNELLCTNVNIGRVENVILNGIDVSEVYGGSSFRGGRWKEYDGAQRRASPIIAGYKLPDTKVVEGGLNFKLADGRHTGYVENIVFDDINFIFKGGNPLSDTAQSPPELGVGQYNVSNLKIQPSYGLWARHVKDLKVRNCTFNYEKKDSRYAIYLNDVQGAELSQIRMTLAKELEYAIKNENSSEVHTKECAIYEDEWGSNAVLKDRITGCSEH